MATRQQIENQIARSAKRYGINRRIFRAQLNQESGLNPNVTSPAGARGVAQFIPSTAKIYGVNLNDGRVADDIDGAARYMRDNLKTFGGSYRKALAAYNAGAGAVQKYGGIPPYSETQAYVKRILQAAGVGDHPSGPSSGAPGPSSAPSAQPASEPATRTETQTAFDAQGYQTAQRRAALGQMIASRNPNSSLLRFGLLSTSEPARSDFTTTTQVQVPTQRTNASDGRLRTGGRKVHGEPAAQPNGPIGGKLLELFYNGPGGVNAKNGQRVQKGFVSGHTDHVHVAAGPRTIQTIAKIAKQEGLAVRELAPYDTVDPVHVQGSYHYKKEAGDFSGTPQQMARFSRRVARIFGIKA